MATTIEEIREKIITQLNTLLTNLNTLTHEDILLSVKSVNELIDIDRGYQSLIDEITKNKTLIENHIKDKNNPHSLTKTTIGLENILNYPATSNPEDDSSEKYVLARGLNIVNNTLRDTKNQIGVIENTVNDLVSRVNTHLSNTNNPHATNKSLIGLSNVANYPATGDINDSSSTKYALAKAVYDLHAKVKNIEIVSDDAYAKVLETRPIKISTTSPSPDQWNNGDLWFVYED